MKGNSNEIKFLKEYLKNIEPDDNVMDAKVIAYKVELGKAAQELWRRELAYGIPLTNREELEDLGLDGVNLMILEMKNGPQLPLPEGDLPVEILYSASDVKNLGPRNPAYVGCALSESGLRTILGKRDPEYIKALRAVL